MSDLRFLQNLEAEFRRVGADAERGARGGRRYLPSPPRIPAGAVAFGLSVLVVAAVLAVFLGARRDGRTGPSTQGFAMVLSASPVGSRPISDSSIDASVAVLSHRLSSVFRGVRVSRAGPDVNVEIPAAAGASRARVLALAAVGDLRTYDWEANVLIPSGKTVVSGLQSHDNRALRISQGSGSATPGGAGAGSMTLYDAVRLASRQAARPGSSVAATGYRYYLFGPPGSAACAAAERARGRGPLSGGHCLLSGPSASARGLRPGLPKGVAMSDGDQFAVAPGTVVLQATDDSSAHTTGARATGSTDPAAQFYVLRDRASLTGSDLTRPQAGTDQSGAPDVMFFFSPHGRVAFHTITATVARRGNLLSRGGLSFNQHFAFVLDDKLISVPSIDFKSYPDGIPGSSGADITGGFTRQSARDLAVVLRYGPLAVSLSPRLVR